MRVYPDGDIPVQLQLNMLKQQLARTTASSKRATKLDNSDQEMLSLSWKVGETPDVNSPDKKPSSNRRNGRDQSKDSDNQTMGETSYD